MFGIPTMAPSVAAVVSALPLSVLIYLLLLYDARRKDSPAAGDTQLGIKTVAAVLLVTSTLMFAIGFQKFLHVMLTFDDFWERLKGALPSVLVGGLVVVAVALVVLPKTNSAEFPKAKRLAAGIVAIVAGVTMLPALSLLVTQLLEWPSWDAVAEAFSMAVDALVIFAIAFMALGRMSGLKMPEAKPKGPPAMGPGQPYAQPPQGYPGQPQQPYAQPAPQGYPGQPQQPYPQQPGQGWPQG